MSKRLFYYAAFAVALGLLFRAASDVHDGLSWRNSLVGWWSWHVVNAVSRDLWQGVLVIYISIRTLMKENVIGKRAVTYIAANITASAVLSYWWHNFLYEWTLDNLRYFYW